MVFNKTQNYIDLVVKLGADQYNVEGDLLKSLNNYTMDIFRSDEQNEFAKPMLWIGMYIALASLICILAMVVDLLDGLRTRKLWFPCKYFTVNAASLTVIAVAMKLPVDLTTSMPGNVDQVTKLGSMAFMCSMMANLLPSLATMGSKELFTNIVALVVLVVTLVVNICIQIATGVVSYEEKERVYKLINPDATSLGILKYLNIITATIYVTLLLMLLIIHICASFAILKSKQIIESQYQAKAKKAQQSGHFTLETLKEHVCKYWIMGGTGSPQFITVCSATTSASGVICVLSTISHIVTVLWTRPKLKSKYCESDYQWSMSMILVTQFIGVVVGTIAPLSRCFAALSFKMSKKRILNHISNVFESESYWTQKLSDWKFTPIPFRKFKVVIGKLKFIILIFLIEVQETVVVTCKMISLIPFFFMMCLWCCVHCLKWMCRASGARDTQQLENLKVLRPYVLRLHEELELHERTLKSLWKSVNRLIQKAEKQQPNNLMELLRESKGFEGLKKFDNNDHEATVLSKEYHCWSLPVVTLTTIVVSLPICRTKAAKFLDRVSEAFKYVTFVEENLNATSDYVSIQKAAKTTWVEVEIYREWLGHKLNDFASKENIRQILEEFSKKAQNIVKEVGSQESEAPNDDSIYRSIICANSMYRLTKTIMDSYQDNTDQVKQADDLFADLSSMISDIVAACLTNLPQAIALKCQSSKIEKLEANVYAAAKLLGETSEIINILKDRVPASLINNPDDLPYIDKWCDHLTAPAP